MGGKKLETLGAQAEMNSCKGTSTQYFFSCIINVSWINLWQKVKNYQPLYTLGVSKEKGMILSPLELQYLLG